MTTPAGLAEQAQEFGQGMTELLLATLPGLPVPPIEILQAGDRVIIRSPPAQTCCLCMQGASG
jgi:hypothetical protein